MLGTLIDLISSVGPFVMLLFVWLSIRLRASNESRTTTGLGLLVSSIVLPPYVAGIPELQFETPIGKSQAVLVWLLQSLVVFEIALRKSRPIANQMVKKVSITMLMFWVIGFCYLIFEGLEIRPFLFNLPIGILLFLALSPDISSIRGVVVVFQFLVIVNLFFVLTKQSFTPENNDAVVQIALTSDAVEYSNFLWGIFDSYERYQGPFPHPNSFGTHIGLICVVLMLFRTKLNYCTLIISWSLLLLSSSRSSIVATAIVSLMYLLFYIRSTRNSNRIFSRSRFGLLGVILLLAITPLILNLNYSLTGRTLLWRQYLSLFIESPWFGKGVDLRYVESTYIYTMASMGVLGFSFLLLILWTTYQNLPKKLYFKGIASVLLFTWFLIRGLTDVVYSYSGWDSGALCFILIALMNPKKYQNPLMQPNLVIKRKSES